MRSRKLTVLALVTALTVTASLSACSPTTTGEPEQLVAEGQSLLVAFLDTTAEDQDPSRLQITVLKSMSMQFEPDDLRVVIVDTADTSDDDLVNFAADWQLRDVSVVADHDGALRAEFDVADAPTTVLQDGDGTRVQTWEGLALSQDLAFAIDAIDTVREID